VAQGALLGQSLRVQPQPGDLGAQALELGLVARALIAHRALGVTAGALDVAA
jgi:hypothetical protein